MTIQQRVLRTIERSPRKTLKMRQIVTKSKLGYMQVGPALQVMHHEYGYVIRDAHGNWSVTKDGKAYLATGERPAVGRAGRPLRVSAHDAARLKAAVRSGSKRVRVLAAYALVVEGKRVTDVAKDLGTRVSTISRVKSVLIHKGVDGIVPRSSFVVPGGKGADAASILIAIGDVRRQLDRIEEEVRVYIGRGMAARKRAK